MLLDVVLGSVAVDAVIVALADDVFALETWVRVASDVAVVLAIDWGYFEHLVAEVFDFSVRVFLPDFEDVFFGFVEESVGRVFLVTEVIYVRIKINRSRFTNNWIFDYTALIVVVWKVKKMCHIRVLT